MDFHPSRAVPRVPGTYMAGLGLDPSNHVLLLSIGQVWGKHWQMLGKSQMIWSFPLLPALLIDWTPESVRKLLLVSPTMIHGLVSCPNQFPLPVAIVQWIKGPCISGQSMWWDRPLCHQFSLVASPHYWWWFDRNVSYSQEQETHRKQITSLSTSSFPSSERSIWKWSSVSLSRGTDCRVSIGPPDLTTSYCFRSVLLTLVSPPAKKYSGGL